MRPSTAPLLGPVAGQRYPSLLRHRSLPSARLVLGLIMVIALYLMVVGVVARLILLVTHRALAPAVDLADYTASALAGERPEGLLASNLAIASVAVICAVIMRYVLGMSPRWLLSVTGRLRWRYLLGCAAVAAVVFLVIQAALLMISGGRLSPQPQFLVFLVVILATSPLQAAAEEVFFRGYLLQSLGSLAPTPWPGIIGSSLLFALAHGVQSPALFVDRFAFGLLAAILVMGTGGLAAGIGTHVVNNVLAFSLAGLTSSITEARQISEIGWDRAVLDVGTFAVIALLCWLLARRLRLAVRTGEGGSGLGEPGAIQ